MTLDGCLIENLANRWRHLHFKNLSTVTPEKLAYLKHPCSNLGKLERKIPEHSKSMQYPASVELPGQVSLPPKVGSPQARALNLDPWPQDVVHWDHWLHSCHSAPTAELLLLLN